MNKSVLENLHAVSCPLLGRTLDEDELHSFLDALDKWPVPAFGPEEFSIYMEDQARGFCLLLKECSTVRHFLAAGKPAEMPIFIGCFVYAEGVDGYHAYSGALPHGITWSDTANSLVSKMGSPMNEIKNKKTGTLTAHRWQVGQWLLTASYSAGGSSLKHLYWGIT